MTNQARGLVTLELAGKTYRLEYTIDALCQLEDRLGVAAVDLFGRIGADRTLALMRTLFWGALREHHGELTERQAGELMRADGGAMVAARTLEAFILAWPGAEASVDAPGNPPGPRPGTKAKAGTGRGSSRSGPSGAAARPKATGGRRRGASSSS